VSRNNVGVEGGPPSVSAALSKHKAESPRRMFRVAGKTGARMRTRPGYETSGRREQTPWQPRNKDDSPPGSAAFRFTFTATRMRSRHARGAGWTRSSDAS